MARANTIQTNFTAGEVSPTIKGRVDIARYVNGAAKLRNFLVKPQGGVFKRTGTIYTGELATSSKKGLLVEFEFSELQAYLLVFEDSVIHFYKDNAQIISGTPVSVATPYLEADLPLLQFAQSADVLYIVHPLYQTRKLIRNSDTSWSFNLYVPADGPYLDENASDTMMTVSNVSDVATIKSTAADFAAGDVGKFVEYNFQGDRLLALISAYVSPNQVAITPVNNVIGAIDPTAVLTYAAPDLTSTAQIFSYANVGAYLRAPLGGWYLIASYLSETHVTVSAPVTQVTTSGIVTISARQITGTVVSSDNVFVASDVGRPMRFNFSAQQVWGTITAYSSAKQVTMSFDRSLPINVNNPAAFIDDGQTVLWKIGAWSATTGWPSIIAFHEERLCFGATPTQPQTGWLSVSGDYENMAPTDNESKVLDTSAITFTIASSKVNAMKWFSSGTILAMGTLGGEWTIGSNNSKDPITPTNIRVVEQTRYGSTTIRPIRIAQSVLFVQRSGRKIREMSYDFNSDTFLSNDITIVNEHILRRGGKAIAVAYQQEPNSILWVVLQDGTLAALTYVKDQQVYAWHPHFIAGSFGSGAAIVESIACLPSTSGTENVLYMIVKRTINGATKRYIERLDIENDPEDLTSKSDFFFVDCGIKQNAGSTQYVQCDHLKGQIVSFLVDGAVRPNAVVSVSTGRATFEGAPGTKISVGLPFSALLQNLPPDAGGEAGTAQGKTKRVQYLVARIYKSLGFKSGPSESNLKLYSFRKLNDPMNESPDLRSDDIKLTFDGSYDLLGQAVIVSDQPYPLNILAIMPMFVTNE